MTPSPATPRSDFRPRRRCSSRPTAKQSRRSSGTTSFLLSTNTLFVPRIHVQRVDHEAHRSGTGHCVRRLLLLHHNRDQLDLLALLRKSARLQQHVEEQRERLAPVEASSCSTSSASERSISRCARHGQQRQSCGLRYMDTNATQTCCFEKHWICQPRTAMPTRTL